MLAPSLGSGWGAGSPLSPKWNLLTGEEGNAEDEPFKFNDMAMAAPVEPSFGGGGCAICSGAGVQGKGAKGPSLSISTDPRPRHQSCIHSGPSPLGPLAPAPSWILTPNLRKPQPPDPRVPREPTERTPAMWPCPCLPGPI